MAGQGEVAKQGATNDVCRVEGGIKCVLPGGRGVERVVLRRPQRPLAEPRGDDLDMRRRLPGLSVGLAASLRSMPTA